MISRLYSQSMRVAAGLRRRMIETWAIDPLLRSVGKSAKILEIGGGYNPRFVKSEYANAYHLDHCTTEELRSKYAGDPSVAHLGGRIQQVDFVADGVPMETVIPAGLKFDVVYSSHAIEHQVDLIGHLKSVETLLVRGGRYIAVIPDYRCCFDVLRFPTVAGDVIAVHLEKHQLHRRKQVFDGFARTISINPGRKVHRPDLAAARFEHKLDSAWKATLECERAGASYVDVHAWVFSPESFELLLIELYMLGLVSLVADFISLTYGNQFCVALTARVPAVQLSKDAMVALERRRLALCKRLRH